MSREDVLSDLNHIRALAEEGRHAPLLSGAHFVGWGLLVSAAYTAHGIILNYDLPGHDGSYFGLIWGSFGVLGGLLSVVLEQRVKTRPGASAVSNRADRAIWTGAMISLVVVVAASIGRMAVTGDATAPNVIPPAAFGAYAGAMFATSLITHAKLLRPYALLAAAAGVVLGLWADAPWMYFAAAVAAFVTLVFPGIALLRREPRGAV
jgi:hypothetical protein